MQEIRLPETCRHIFMKNIEEIQEYPLVLVVDDDDTVRLLMRAALEKAQFRVIEAENGAIAIRMFGHFRPDIVLLDIFMPGMDGFSVLSELRRSAGGEVIPILIVTGLDDIASIIKAFDMGATDFITKPINWTILGYRIHYHVRAGRTLVKLQESENHLAHAQRIAHLGHWQWHKQTSKLICSSECRHIFGFNLDEEQETYQPLITASHPDDRELIAQTLAAALTDGESFNIDYRIVLPDGSEHTVNLQGQAILDEGGKPSQLMGTAQDITERKRAELLIKKNMKQLQKTLEGAVCALSSAVEIRDPYTAGHQKLVAQLAGAIAQEMGLSACQIKGVKVAGALHDLGKMGIPAEILCKPSQLTEIEFSMIRNHSQVGYDVLKEVDFPWPIAPAVLQHHERWDGSGYPHGLTGTDILQEARILAVADVVESMSHHRPYRAAHQLDKVLSEIRDNRGIKYEPDVVDACLKVLRKGFKFT